MEVLDRNDEVVVACNPFLDATPDRRYEIRRRDDAMMMEGANISLVCCLLLVVVMAAYLFCDGRLLLLNALLLHIYGRQAREGKCRCRQKAEAPERKWRQCVILRQIDQLTTA